MKFWDNITKTFFLRFESVTNNEQEKPQLVVFFFFFPFVFRSFSEEETLLERRVISCSSTSPFQTVQGTVSSMGTEKSSQSLRTPFSGYFSHQNCTGMALEIPKGKLLSITSKSATLNSVNIPQKNQVLDFSYRTEQGIQSI